MLNKISQMTISEQTKVHLGYMRVSKSDGSQSIDLQRDALLAAGLETNRLYQDLMSGRSDDRPGLKACLKALQPGNVLVVWKLDRLGRSLRDLVNIVHELAARGIGVKVLTGQGAMLDTTTPHGQLMFNFFAMLSEYERDLIVERTRAGIEAARARGRKGGRPQKMTADKIRSAQALIAIPNTSVIEVAKTLGISTPSLYTYLNGDGSLKEPGVKIIAEEAERVSAKKPRAGVKTVPGQPAAE
ncbi:Resolvase-like protein [Devosia sp. LC5]|uniref:recombinase family protein n=1 Tax=Devosia sp. LC5 TaxID=1502724 RepID=UPI0004E36757|nr:recombinase family protein [Devosia sp. LC5]KFC70186.1 Resolvase-like protein [Devosia sp. LC5]